MKKLIFYIASVIIFITIMVSCKSDQAKSQDTQLKSSTRVWGMLDTLQRDSLTNLVLEEYFKQLQGNKSLMINTGKPISADTAALLTQTYYLTLGATPAIENRKRSAKSVYFEATEIIAFLDSIRSKGLCPDGNTLGVRFYFAKYPSDWGSTTPSTGDDFYAGQNTIIVRGVCNGNDIGHSSTLGMNAAWNFGDVCPPLCDYTKPTSRCTGGEYNHLGPFTKSCP
jgi:hypothetical protein